MTLLKGERYTHYHVRAVYSEGSMSNPHSVAIASEHERLSDDVDGYLGAMGLDFVGYAVYGCAPEGTFVCGDELSFVTCDIIANLLNIFYNDRTIDTT